MNHQDSITISYSMLLEGHLEPMWEIYIYQKVTCHFAWLDTFKLLYNKCKIFSKVNVKQTNCSLQFLSMPTLKTKQNYLCSTYMTSQTIKIWEIKNTNLSSNQRGKHTHGVKSIKYTNLGDICMFCYCFFFKKFCYISFPDHFLYSVEFCIAILTGRHLIHRMSQWMESCQQ